MFLSTLGLQRPLSGTALVRFLALAPMALSLVACSSDHTSNQNDSLSAGIVREGDTTSAALNALLSRPGDDWGWAGGQFDAPTDQAVLPMDTPTSFAWHADPTTAPDPSDTLLPTKQNGQAFFLTFSVPSNPWTTCPPNPLRVFTSLTSYTPDAAAWQKLVLAGAGVPVAVNITSATFENDLLTSDGGPHIGQTITVTLQ